MNRQQHIPWEKLAQYFAGELTGEEHRDMKNWIKADPVREEQIEQLYEIWKESGKLPFRLNTDKSWSRLLASMDDMDLQKKVLDAEVKQIANLYRFRSSTKFRKAGVMARRITIAAATVLIILSAGLFTLHYQSVQESIVADVQHRVIMTKDGERASYILSDGSRVILHAGSRLEIPEDYNTENRELHLEGEAYFETAHNPEKPFIVHSEYSYTRVVGTRFLVQAWPESDRVVEVVVSEGRVLFGDNRISESSGASKEVLLYENQRGVLSSNSGPVVNEVTDLDWYFGWTEGRMVFENRELREVLPRLERWYDIKIEIADHSIEAKKITAEIDYSLPMSDVLRGIAMSLNLEVEKSDNRIVTFK